MPQDLAVVVEVKFNASKAGEAVKVEHFFPIFRFDAFSRLG
jgi:hypothetical protein